MAARRGRVYAALVLAMLVPLAVLAVSATLILQRQTAEDRTQEGRQIALSTAAAVRSMLSSSSSYLEAFAARARMRDAMELGAAPEMRAHLENALQLHPRFLFVSTYKPDGTMTAIFPPDPILGKNYAFRDWYRGVSREWKPYVSEVYRTEVAPNPLVAAVAVPVFGRDGAPLGILMAAYKVETLAEMVGKVSAAGGWKISVLDQRRQVVTGEGKAIQGFHPAQLGTKWGEAGAGFVRHGNESSLAAYAPVPTLDWGIVVEQPAEVVYQPVRALQAQLLVFGMVAVGLSIGGLALLAGLYRELDAAKRFFDLSAELFCTADFQGRFTRLNPAWETTLGAPLETLLAKPFLEWVHPDDRESTIAEAQKLEQGGRTVHFANRYRTADGSYRWLEWSAIGSVRSKTIYAVAKDVTESRQIARMKDEFVSTVSHELRTPLASLRGFAELMLEREFPEERRREFLEIIRRESTRLANLVNDFLDLQRIEAGRQELRLETRDLLPVLRQAAETFAGSSERHRIVLDIPAPLPRLTFDADRTAQVLANLISNAIKYSPEGGEIVVGARADAGEAVVWVKDRGLGIPAEEVPKLFTKFQRVNTEAHREIGGTGLGLALVKQLVELQGGRVGVETAAGEGSTFYFTLPIAAALALPQELAPSRPAAAPDVLIVEDDAAFANLLRTHFESLGLQVASTSRAEEALAWIRQARPGVVLLDIVLPGMSGWEFLLQVKSDEILKSLPVVVVTVTEPNVRGLVLGGADYLPKTVPPERLAESIRGRMGGGHGKRVLVVDDDPLFRRALAERLRREREWVVEEAGNGQEALQILWARAPDLLVLDLLMPVMDGFEVLRRLREDRRALDLQVLVVTGKDLSQQEVEYIRRRMACLVGKREVQLEYFTEVVEGALGRELRKAARV